jgi:hypothetical protein
MEKINFINSINDLSLEDYRNQVLSFMKTEYETLPIHLKVQSIGRQSIIVGCNNKETINEYFLREFNMDKFDSLLVELKSLEINQQHSDWAECLPDEIWKSHFSGNFEQLDRGLNVDKRRHYETSVDVIEIYGRILGIRYITNLYSEQSDYGDCCHIIEFFEMKPIQTISYVPIN